MELNSIQATELLAKLHKKSQNQENVLSAGVGTAITAKTCEVSDADFLVVYNSGSYRRSNTGGFADLLSYGDANLQVLAAGKEVLPIVPDVPVLAGVCGTDPYKVMEQHLQEVKKQGFIGVQNYPTVGIIDGTFRRTLESTGMGYDLEVKMIRKAHEQGLLTVPYVFDSDQAQKMVHAGADIIVVHFGLKSQLAIGTQQAQIRQTCLMELRKIIKVVHKIKPQTLILCHGGTVLNEQDLVYLKEKTPELAGFFTTFADESLAHQKDIEKELEMLH
ncbi:phosphoenolpyruvate hydrolase family protein [Ligilactobacillus ceti]|uniref:TIM-barrel domain-containing protein n=1 Tax=Ligilactobacillus ceti DSM 22408 TaxID=1122146 RepID=A0A0R2KRY7_9LACO|nr:phosphoenolpyruvate hydrolase family protein [Ligilactobacillus ceti]KRN89354.1 hypothetical protein IV53_GL000071 [Ligilactobacillus ceti DSM 22408]